MSTQTPREPFLTDLLVYPTHRCNLKCRHCYFAPTYDTRVTREAAEVTCDQICRAVDELLPFGLARCKFSGGEPLLRDDLLTMCSRVDAKGVRVIIETNGTLVEERHAEGLRRLHRRPFVSVSIDGAVPATHEALRGVEGSFHRTLRGIGYLISAGIKVQAIAAVHEGNKGEIPALMDMCAARGIRSVKVCFITSIGRARDFHLIDRRETLDLDEQFADYAARAGIRYRSSIPVALKSANRIVGTCAMSNRCNIVSTLGILADGTITICGMGRHVADFRFGKLGIDDLPDLWMSHPVLHLIRTSIPNRLRGGCGRCIARLACMGHCRLANENATADDLLEPFSMCDEMEKMGLFPKSRLVERSHVLTASA